MARRNTQLSSMITAGTSTIERPADNAAHPPDPEPIPEPGADAAPSSDATAAPLATPTSIARQPQSRPIALSAAPAGSDQDHKRVVPGWQALITNPRDIAATFSGRRTSPTRTVDGRISRPVAAAFAAHCSEDLDNMSQADLVEVILRTYLDAVGKSIKG